MNNDPIRCAGSVAATFTIDSVIVGPAGSS
jgi:hypothetical protein